MVRAAAAGAGRALRRVADAHFGEPEPHVLDQLGVVSIPRAGR